MSEAAAWLQKPVSGVWSECLDFADGVGSLPLNGAADGRGVEDDEAAGRGFGWKPRQPFAAGERGEIEVTKLGRRPPPLPPLPPPSNQVKITHTDEKGLMGERPRAYRRHTWRPPGWEWAQPEAAWETAGQKGLKCC